MSNLAMNLVRRLFRTKYIIVWLLVILVIYVFMNNLFFKIMDNNGDGMHGGVADYEHAPGQLDQLKQRLNNLEDSLENSKRNVDELNALIKDVFQSINESMVQNNKLNQVPVVTHRTSNVNKKEPVVEKNDEKEVKIAVLVISCNRAKSVENHLSQLIKYRLNSNSVNTFPIVVSQDCNDAQTAQSIQTFSNDLFASLKQPDQSDIVRTVKGDNIEPHLRGYYKISRHYKWALEQIFMKYAFDSVIITEDDLNVAEDFFDYFQAMYRPLSSDSSLFCVSAWNDNGKKSLIDTSRPELVHRSDFFPGLGWMLTRDLWLELRDKWPESYWDDWIRDRAQRKNRSCLRPEISRTEMAIEFAKNGVSKGQFFDKFLKLIVLNKSPVKWSHVDASKLTKSNFDSEFLTLVYNRSLELTYESYLKTNFTALNDPRDVLILYKTKEDFLKYAKYFDIMEDFKDGVPRTAYFGIVRIYFNSRVVYLAPNDKYKWKGYDPTW